MLARLCDPPDTSALESCSECETSHAVALAHARLLRRRRDLAATGVGGPALERLVAALRRLESGALRAYRAQHGVVLSEPFGAVPSVIVPVGLDRARELVGRLLRRRPPVALVAALACFGEAALERVVSGGVRAAIVARGRPFSQCSRSVAALVPDIDRWQAPPAGLFVLEERLLLLRSHALRMAAAHEFAHALDAVLARRPRSYFSFENPAVREAFAAAPGFVDEYAASGLDEYFAESLRAYVEVNDDRASWLPLTRQALLLRDPRMFALVERMFTHDLAAGGHVATDLQVRARSGITLA